MQPARLARPEALAQPDLRDPRARKAKRRQFRDPPARPAKLGPQARRGLLAQPVEAVLPVRLAPLVRKVRRAIQAPD